MLSFDEIKELIDIVCDRRLQEVEIERAGFRVKIQGQIPGGVATTAIAPQTAPAAHQGAAPLALASLEREATRAAAGEHVVQSPIVGTFYAAPSPDAEPYVLPGDQVKAGQVLCIVEAMKLMNEIESDIDGEVVRVLVKNAQAVEFGEPLFALKPA